MGEKYLYLSAIPRDINSNFEFLLASSYCPLLNGTDIHCINAKDCEILKRYQIECPLSSTSDGQVDDDDDDKMSLKWLIPVIVLIVVIVIATICIVKRRYQYQKVSLTVVLFLSRNFSEYAISFC